MYTCIYAHSRVGQSLAQWIYWITETLRTSGYQIWWKLAIDGLCSTMWEGEQQQQHICPCIYLCFPPSLPILLFCHMGWSTGVQVVARQNRLSQNPPHPTPAPLRAAKTPFIGNSSECAETAWSLDREGDDNVATSGPSSLFGSKWTSKLALSPEAANTLWNI